MAPALHEPAGTDRERYSKAGAMLLLRGTPKLCRVRTRTSATAPSFWFPICFWS